MSASATLMMETPETNSDMSANIWSWAFKTICSSRAFSYLWGSSTPQNYTNINQWSITQLVKNRDLRCLQELGGVDGIVTALETHVENGIHEDNANAISRRQETFGTNTYCKMPAKTFFSYFKEPLKGSSVNVLGAFISLVSGMIIHGPREGWYEGGGIFGAVFLVITVSAISNFKQNRQWDKLSQTNNDIQVKVVRNKRHQQISIFDVVVGDIVCLNIGDQVPADGLFVSGHSLRIDESSMIGESDYKDINRKNPYLLSGSTVEDGYGSFVVTSVGMDTTWGKAMSKYSRESPTHQTPLIARLNKLSYYLGQISLAVAFIVHVVLMLWFSTGNTKDEDGNTKVSVRKRKVEKMINGILEIVLAAISILFVAIPEGLTLAVTLVLSYSMKRMMADKASVRKLSACETIGSATTICTDKTGTLTMNMMKVTKFWLGKLYDIEKNNFVSIASSVLKLLHQGAGLNTAGSVYMPYSGSDLEFSGSPTEKAILSWVVKELQMDVENTKKKSSIIRVKAFSSAKKRSGILLKNKEDNTMHVHWKGAAETIIAMCSNYYGLHGNIYVLDDSEREIFNQIVQGMAASSLRCIAFAHKQVSEHECDDKNQKLVEDNLVLLGLVGIKDPCRPGVRKAVQNCQLAGVNIKMITGDSVYTAKAIATECGILRLNREMDSAGMYSDAVVEGVEFRNYTTEERMEKIDKISVMARSSPYDIMVQCLKKKGHIVAVTGDGTKDALALYEADIGLSMGIAGTEVAKQNSDIVILDDNFESVACALRWGRCVYKNIQKFIQFQLTVNVAALAINFVAAVSTGEVPLTAVKLVWINMIMDTLGVLALATERPYNALMYKGPVDPEEPLISYVMWRNLIAQAVYQILVLLIFQFRGQTIFDVNKKVKDTIVFNTFVLCQVFNLFNARKLENKNVFAGIRKNRLFLIILGLIIILQALMIEVLVKFADTERLSWGQWRACIKIAILSLPIGFLVKFIPVPDEPFLPSQHNSFTEEPFFERELLPLLIHIFCFIYALLSKCLVMYRICSDYVIRIF